MNHTRTTHFERRTLLLVLFFAGFCPTCNRVKPDELKPPKAPAETAASSTVVVAAPMPSLPEPQPRSACAGKYQGQYAVTGVKSDLTRKDGAPERWGSDDGQTLAGSGELTLVVDPQNIITGSAKGALGQQTLRGSCDENTLRAQLDTLGDSDEQIQNAVLVAGLTGDQASGTLAAGTGNSLIRRTGTVTLRKAQ